jgi:signal transduction histidine kinase
MGFTSELQRSEAVLSNQIRTLKEKHREALEPDAVLVVEEDIPEAISYIRASTAKMDRLINAILKLSRDGRRELAVEVVDMTALARGLADTLAQQTGAVGATITVEDLPPIATDRVGMELIIGNIVENAVKYLDPNRPGDIRITGRRLGNRNAYVVADNGRGIDPKDHERVFELFRRAGPQDKPGEGLGLSFVRSAVYRLGGQLEMESAPGVGTTFTLIFPTVPPDPVEPEPYSTGARAA